MAHELEIVNGEASVFVARKPAWHNLGVVTPDVVTADEAIKLGKLDWEVTKSPIYATFGDTQVEVPGKVATIRENPDGGEPIVLGVVGSDYSVFQNHQAFSFLDALVDQDIPLSDADKEFLATIDPSFGIAKAKYETAGVLGRGERVFITVELPVGVTISRDGVNDTTKFFLVCTTSHDGSLAFTVAITPIRIVCANTARAALKAAKSTWAIRHTVNAEQRLAEARHTLGLSLAYREEWEGFANSLADSPITDIEFGAILSQLWPTDGDSDASNTKNGDRQDVVKSLYHHSPTQLGFTGTRWGAYNAITEYLDHYRPTYDVKSQKGLSTDQRRSLTSLYSPSVENFRNKATNLILAGVN